MSCILNVPSFSNKKPSISNEKPWISVEQLGISEGVYVTIGKPAFRLFLYLTGVHFRGELQQGGDVRQ